MNPRLSKDFVVPANGQMYRCFIRGSSTSHAEVVGGTGEKKKERLKKKKGIL